MIELSPEFAEYYSGPDAFDRVMALEGDLYRSLDGRRTLRFVQQERGYFIKIHRGVGWKEIFKNLSQFRLPVLGAQNEWRAIRRLEELGVETMTIAGLGKRGWNPARIESFVITDELTNCVSLEDFCRSWPLEPPEPALKRALIEKVAGIARRLHESGVNHRDFYLCHFLLDQSGALDPEQLRAHLIDLHRVQLRRKTPRRWIVKDVAGLYFSSMDIGLTRRDIFRFMEIYSGRPLRETLGADPDFWRQVSRRAVKLYKKDFQRTPKLAVGEF